MYRTAPTSPDDIDIRALGRAVWMRWRLIAALVAAAGALTFVGLSFFTPLYTSEARILINNEESAFTRPATGNTIEPVAPKPDPEAVASQVQVLQSRDLAQQVVKNLNLDAEAEFNAPGGLLVLPRMLLTAAGVVRPPSDATLQERVLDNFFRKLTIFQFTSSRVIAVRFTSEQPELAAKVANALSQEYLTWQQREKLRQTVDATQWLNSQIEELRKKVEESEARADGFRSKSGLFVTGQNNVTLNSQQLSELNSQLILARAARTEAEARAKLIDKMLRERGDVDAAPDVLQSQLIQRLLEQRVQVQRQLAELSATRLPSHPRIRQLQSELADVRRQIRDEASKIVKSLENESQIAGARETSLRQSLNELKLDSASSNEDQIRLRALDREAKANRDLLESYLARYRDASARRDESSVPADASFISRAHISNVPSFPKKVPLTLLVMAAVGLLTFAMILAREVINVQRIEEPRRYPDMADARFAAMARSAPSAHETKAEPVAIVAEAPVIDGVQRSSPAASTPGPGLDTSLEGVARLLLGRIGHGGRRRVLVVDGEGKAGAADEVIALARILAAHGQRTALVDLSARGTLAERLRLPPVPGIQELAAGRASFEQVVRLDPGGSVQVFANGNPRLGPANEPGRSVERVLGALDEAYECAVVYADQPGASLLADAGGDAWLAAVAVSEPGSAGGPVGAALAARGIETIDCRRQTQAEAPRPGVLSRLPFLKQRTAAAV